MIFDDLPPPAAAGGSESLRRRRRRRSARDAGASRRLRPADPHVARARPMPAPAPNLGDRNHTAWLAVLVLLAVAALGFGWFLRVDRSAPRPLAGEAPSLVLMPLIDPILAPLETGTSGYSAETLSDLEEKFRVARQAVNLDDQEIFGAAASMAQILSEAREDRQRHIDRLARIGSPVQGVAVDGEARARISDAERRHLELAVGISWQRNATLYRNRVEELWYRLQRLERGRFSGGSAPAAMTPDLPEEL